MAIVDVHCHLSSEAFAEDLRAVLSRAAQAGVTNILAVGEDAVDNERVLALARRHTGVHAALGHHPDRVDEEAAERALAQIRAHREELVAIGEVGIDHWTAKEPDERARQHAIFRRFVALGAELDLPLSIHTRSAGHYAIDILAEMDARRVCLHAFDGKAGHALRAAERGWFLSVPPSVVRSPQKQKMVRALPLSRLLLETDAPVLGPDRTQRNEPANALLSARTIAELKGVELADVLEACRENTRRLFGI